MHGFLSGFALRCLAYPDACTLLSTISHALCWLTGRLDTVVGACHGAGDSRGIDMFQENGCH